MEENQQATNTKGLENQNSQLETKKKTNYALIIFVFILGLTFIFSIVFYVNSLSKSSPPAPKNDIKSPTAEPTVTNEKPSPIVEQKSNNGNFKAISGDDSMSPTIKSGDEVKIDLFFDGTLNRSDIILIRAEVISRIVGLPGEKIMIKNGSVYLNGEKLNEPYLATSIKTSAGTFLKEGREIEIPNNEYAYLGDNRFQSKDTRDLGFIKTSDITGIVKLGR